MADAAPGEVGGRSILRVSRMVAQRAPCTDDVCLKGPWAGPGLNRKPGFMIAALAREIQADAVYRGFARQPGILTVQDAQNGESAVLRAMLMKHILIPVATMIKDKLPGGK